jgi:large subunit ribosomal protein L16
MKKLTFKPQEKKQKRVHMVLPGRINTKKFYESEGLALIALSSGFLSSKCIEACRRVVRRAVKRAARLKLRLRPFLPVTAKPAEVRMGKGKGKIDDYLYPVTKGSILFELNGVGFYKGKLALRKTQSKLPFPSRLISLYDRF